MLGQALTSSTLTLILTCIVFLGFVYQLYSKRINGVGILAFLALLLLFLGFIIEGSVSLITIILFIVGVIFIVLELFIMGAVLGIVGVILVVISILTMGNNPLMMWFNVVVALLLTSIEWVIIVKFFKKRISFFEDVILNDSTNKESGYTSHNDNSHLLEKEAMTYTDLRPSGIILLDNERIDAVTEGSFISKNTKVKIIEVEGTRVVVREIHSN